MIIHLIVGLIKKTLYKMSQYFKIAVNIKIKLDLSSYTTKTDFKIVAHVEFSNFALKSNLAYLKNEVDKIGFVLKTKYQTDKLDIQKKINETGKKIPDTSAPVKKHNYNYYNEL